MCVRRGVVECVGCVRCVFGVCLGYAYRLCVGGVLEYVGMCVVGVLVNVWGECVGGVCRECVGARFRTCIGCVFDVCSDVCWVCFRCMFDVCLDVCWVCFRWALACVVGVYSIRIF